MTREDYIKKVVIQVNFWIIRVAISAPNKNKQSCSYLVPNLGKFVVVNKQKDKIVAKKLKKSIKKIAIKRGEKELKSIDNLDRFFIRDSKYENARKNPKIKKD